MYNNIKHKTNEKGAKQLKCRVGTDFGCESERGQTLMGAYVFLGDQTMILRGGIVQLN